MLAILDGSSPTGLAKGDVVFVCEDVDVALDVDGKRLIACAHPSHGYAPRYSNLARRMAEIRKSLPDSASPCLICGGCGWLPIHSGAALKQYALMRAIGYFRGLQIPQLVRDARVGRDDAADGHSMSGVR